MQTTVTCYNTTFKLNRPHKYDILNMLMRLETGLPIMINGVDDIYPEEKSISFLKKVIAYANYCDDRAYFTRKDSL